MKKEINIVILSIITGLLNSFYIGLSLALTSGDPEFTTNEIIGHVCFWSSTVHVLISSWLFIYSKLIGRIVAILTSSIGMIASVMILSDGESLLWFSILIGFVLTILFHAKNLNRIKW